MTSIRHGSRHWVIVLVAMLGALCGGAATRRPAHACECTSDAWRVGLRSVESDDPALDHTAYWPTEGELSSYSGHAHIWSLTLPPGQVHRITAGQW